MKIQGRKNFGLGPVGSVGLPGQAARTEEVGGAAADSIEISSASREVDTLREAVGTIPDIRSERIDGIRVQVEDGSYYVETQKLAKKVVDEALGDAIKRHYRMKAEVAE